MKNDKKLYTFTTEGGRYIKRHPQLLFTLLLIVVIPVAFLVSAQQFLDASHSNQDRLEKDRIGLLHDAFVSIIEATGGDRALLQKQIENIAAQNPDITLFRVAKKTPDGYVPIAALDDATIGHPDSTDIPYDLAFTNPDESLVQTIEGKSGRYLRGFRLLKLDGENMVIMTLTSRSAVDALFASRIHTAYIWLVVLLIIVLALVIRHVKLIDYAHLYHETKKANEAKDMFTNMVAHELRAPLTAVRGYASIIRENVELPADIQEDARRIEESSARLVRIVSDLLDIARIQSGRMSVKRESVDLTEVVRASGALLEHALEQKHIALDYQDIPKDVMVNADGERLKQAITNILSNAIKYTPRGSITISLEQRSDRVELRVQDTGTGIGADEQKQLFAPFFRTKSADQSKTTGTGLGMWITKQLIEAMGGSIGVESIRGIGTHIVVTLQKS